MTKIAVTTTTFGKYDDAPLRLCAEKGIELILNDKGRTLTGDETVSIARGAQAIIAGTEKLDRNVIERLDGIRVISRCGSGMDNVDVPAAEKKGIKVFNTPNGPTDAVAELTVGLILNMLRRVNEMDSDLRSGGWNKRMGHLLSGKNLGIIGFGRIGSAVAKIGEALNASVRFCDTDASKGPGAIRMGFEEILKWADIISIHIPFKPGAGCLIGKKDIYMMKKGAWIVNVSRGGVVDETALYDSLKDGHLNGASIDVFEKEPYSGPLKELKNVVLTPHVGSYAVEARTGMEIESVENVITGLGI